jgi:hypothetical protein
MPLDHAGSHQTRSDDSWPLPSPAAVPGTIHPNPQRMSNLAGLNLAPANFSSPTRTRSRSSTATSLTASVRPGSGIAVSDFRDVLTPIPNDPFSRRGDRYRDRYADHDPDNSDDGSTTEAANTGDDNEKTPARLPLRRDSLRNGPSYYYRLFGNIQA